MKKILPNQRRAWWAAAVLVPAIWLVHPLNYWFQKHLEQRFLGIPKTESARIHEIIQQNHQTLLAFNRTTIAVLALVAIVFLRWYVRAFGNLRRAGFQPEEFSNGFVLQRAVLYPLWPFLLARDQWADRYRNMPAGLPSGNFFMTWGLWVVLHFGMQLGVFVNIQWQEDDYKRNTSGFLFPWAELSQYAQILAVLLILFGMWRINRVEQQLQSTNR